MVTMYFVGKRLKRRRKGKFRKQKHSGIFDEINQDTELPA